MANSKNVLEDLSLGTGLDPNKLKQIPEAMQNFFGKGGMLDQILGSVAQPQAQAAEPQKVEPHPVLAGFDAGAKKVGEQAALHTAASGGDLAKVREEMINAFANPSSVTGQQQPQGRQSPQDFANQMFPKSEGAFGPIKDFLGQVLAYESQKFGGVLPGSQTALAKNKALMGATEKALPLSQYEEKSIQSQVYTAQVTAAKDLFDKSNQESAKIIEQFKALDENLRKQPLGWLKQVTGGSEALKEAFIKEMDKIKTSQTEAQDKLVNLLTTHPNANESQISAKTSAQKFKLPSRSQAPKGAKGWDTEKGTWVF